MFEHLKGKKLYRSPKDALVFGVAAGFAQYLRVDVTVVRLALVALAVLTRWTPVAIVYILGLVLIPIDPTQDTVASTQEPKDVTPASGAEKMDASQNF